MSEDQRRPEATHRQRAALGESPPQLVDVNGRMYADLSNSCSDLIPSVQFGNILVGPVTIRRLVPVDPTPEELAELDTQLAAIIEISRNQQKAAEFVCAAERRVVQWAIDPSTRVQNPANGSVVTPDGDVPAEQAPPVVEPAAPSGKPDPAVVAPPPSAQ